MIRADLSGRVALVVGSTQGIGKEIALLFAENGGDIVVHGKDSTPEPGQALVQRIEAMGRKAIFEEADMYNYSEIRRMVDKAIEAFGKIDILVASGGAAGLTENIKFFRETDPNDYIVLAQSQWLNRAYCVKAVLESMIQNQYGKVVMIGTDAGRIPTPGESMIGASGAALVLMTKALAHEFARWKIRVNAICLTVISDSLFLQGMLRSGSPASKVFQKALDMQPFPVCAKDVAQAALFLASDVSDAITGQILSVNGGLSFPG